MVSILFNLLDIIYMPKIYKYKNQASIKKNKHKSKKSYTRKKRGGNNSNRSIIHKSGSDIRYELVRLCKHNKWNEYDALTQKIMKDYWVNGKKDFFIHLDRNIKSFSLETLNCLRVCLTQLQEDAIPESMPHLYYIMKMQNK